MVVNRTTGTNTSPDPQRASRVVSVAAALSATGGFLFGYDTGVIGGVLSNITTEFDVSGSFDTSFIVSVLLLGAVFGALIAGRVADRLGRRKLVLITGVVFLIGLIIHVVAPSLWMLNAGRFIVGVGVGAASFGVPLYVSELAPPSRRGRLATLNQIALGFGIFSSQIIAYFLAPHGDWRISVGLALIPTLILTLGVIRQPESAAWLVRKGRDDEAIAVLRRIRGSDAEAQAEFTQILAVTDEERRANMKSLLAPTIRPALTLGIALAVIQQITGINTVVYFAPTTLEEAGLEQSASLGAVIAVGATIVVFATIASWRLDHTGRRRLLLVGTTGMAIGLAALAVAFSGGLTTTSAVCAVIALCFYIGSFGLSLGPIFWLLIAEIFPLHIRGKAAAVCTMVNWTSNLAVSLVYLPLLSTLGTANTFWLLTALTVVSLAYMARTVPETKGRSLAEIEHDLMHGRMSPAAN
jgi:sugar porter (SP) family MFS transporter